MLKQPVSIVNYTNVAIVRLKVNKDKFEVACYKNKIKQYREKIEHNIDEVLQVSEIFTNAIKGDKANKKDLEKHFPEMTNKEIIDLILNKGDLQVSEKERESALNNVKCDIASIISEKTFDLKTGKPISYYVILKAMDDIGVIIKEHEDAKKQALKLIKQLQDQGSLNIERRYMKLGISVKKGSVKYLDVNDLCVYLKEIKAVDVKEEEDSLDDLLNKFSEMHIELVEEEMKERKLEEGVSRSNKPKKNKKDEGVITECFKFFKNKKITKLVSPGCYRDLMSKFEDSKRIIYDNINYIIILLFVLFVLS